MRQVKVISLDDFQNIDEAMVGAKSMSLVRIKQIGLAVPAGFCVTAATFREHLEANDIISRIESTLAELAGADLEAKRFILANLRQAIIEAPLVEELREQIENHYRSLAAGRVAVRSSATAEDLPDHSFAGQYETYLGVADIAGCIDAVKKCWASLWTERAYEYREQNGIDHEKVNMAVIVQSLIPADASGVIFTTDPVTGSSSRIIVEACFGLGQALVSGKVKPDRFIVRKCNLKIISSRVSDKNIQCIIDKLGSIKEEALEDERACTQCTDNKIVKKLAKLAKKAEAKLGCPQDIEWAIRGNKIYFLQSRPITVIPPKKSWEERQVWTNANAGEVLPDVVTPITWSMIQIFANTMFVQTFNLVGVELGDNPLIGLVAGRAYFNINTPLGMAIHFPESWNLKLDEAFGGENKRMFELAKVDIPDEDIPDVGFGFAKMLFHIPRFFFYIFSHTLKKGECFLAELKNKNEQLQNLNVSAMPEEKPVKSFTTAVIDALESWNLIYNWMGFFAFTGLDRICTKWLGDQDGTFANRLLAGLQGIEDAQAGLDLWQLARKAHEILEVERAVLSGDDWDITREKISEVQQGDQFLEGWDEFMIRHGHHCQGEIELYNARWSETPDYILSLVRNYIKSVGQIDPLGDYVKRAQQRDRLAAQCRQQLKNPIKRSIFNYLLKNAERGFSFRENLKSEVVRYIAGARRMLVELGRRLYSRAILASADDIFFLEFEEIEPVVQNKADFDVKKVIAYRRAEYEKNKSITPPKVVVGKFDPDDYTPDTVDTDAEVLNGLAVSSGIVTGKARVILRADTDEHVLAGEILVAPFTDPGWTPYFMPAAAIVMDIGGLLSHGSIIAREYGIPAVVNVGPATKIIKTGQTIQVDANRGIVRILR